MYRPLNDVLRERKREAVKPWFPFLKLLMQGLRALPTVPGATTWRGVKKDLSKSFRKGKKFFDWSVVSTSTDELTVQRFLGKSGPRTLIRVHGFTGVDIEKLSAFQESEVIFKPGTRFEVKSMLDTGTLTVVEIHELPGDGGAPIPSPAPPHELPTYVGYSGAPAHAPAPSPATALVPAALKKNHLPQAAISLQFAAVHASEKGRMSSGVCGRVASGEITTLVIKSMTAFDDVRTLAEALKTPSCRLVVLRHVPCG